MWIRSAVLLAGAVALVSGCGGGGGDETGSFTDQSGDDMFRAASQEMKDVHSMRIAGDIRTGGLEARVDVSATTGGDCSGSVTIQGGSAEVSWWAVTRGSVRMRRSSSSA